MGPRNTLPDVNLQHIAKLYDTLTYDSWTTTHGSVGEHQSPILTWGGGVCVSKCLESAGNGTRVTFPCV